MKYKIALIKGDGIGPEIVDSAVRVLQKAGEKFGHSFAFQDIRLSAAAPSTPPASRCPEETVDRLPQGRRFRAARRGGRPEVGQKPARRSAPRSKDCSASARSARPVTRTCAPLKLYPAAVARRARSRA